MPTTIPAAHSVPQQAYPTPPRFIGAVLRFLIIAALDRFTRRLRGRLRDEPHAAQRSEPAADPHTQSRVRRHAVAARASGRTGR